MLLNICGKCGQSCTLLGKRRKISLRTFVSNISTSPTTRHSEDCIQLVTREHFADIPSDLDTLSLKVVRNAYYNIVRRL